MLQNYLTQKLSTNLRIEFDKSYSNSFRIINFDDIGGCPDFVIAVINFDI